MVAERHYMSPDIRSTMTNLKKEWKDLSDKAKDKGIKLRQAAQQVIANFAQKGVTWPRIRYID